MMKTIRILYAKKIIFIITLIFIFSNSYSQEGTGTVKGTVFNIFTGEPLPYANIVVLGANLGAISDDDGNFKIENVPLGIVNIQATYIGFNKQVKTDIMVMAFKPAVVEFKLEESAFESGGIEVRPEYFPQVYDEPVSTKNQSSEEIRRLPGGFEDVVRANSILPGVAQVEAGRNDLIIRGGSPSENLYIVENIEVPNINHFGTQGATGGPASFLNLNLIRETTLIKTILY